MSGVSAKRLGMAQGGLELEQRLRRIEQEIEKKADANINVGVTSKSRLIPLQIKGLAIEGGVQSWRLSWQPNYASDLSKYEVHISDTITFNTFTVYDVTTNYFQYTVEPDPLEDVPLPNYVRVRAVTLVGFPGAFSDTFDVTTGLLVTADFEQGAVTGLVEWSMTSGFDQLTAGTAGKDPWGESSIPPGDPFPAANPNSEAPSQSLGPAIVSAHSLGVIVPYLTMEVELQSMSNYNTTNTNKLNIVVKRRLSGEADTELSNMTLDYFTYMPASRYWWSRGVGLPYPYRYQFYSYADPLVTVPIHIPLLPDQPGEGTWEYRVDLSVSSDANDWILIWPQWVKIAFIEFRR